MKSVPLLRTGDVIGFSSWDWLDVMINITTYGIPGISVNHVGIVGDYKDEKVIFEAGTLCSAPCIIQGPVFLKTQVHRLNDLYRGYWGRLYHYPLVDPLDYHQRQTLNDFLIGEVGKSYDFLGAVRSAGSWWSYFQGIRYPGDDSRLFCSEFCAMAHRKIGLFRTINPSKWNPNAFVRAEYEQGILQRRIRFK